ncbi:hypothetical protein [Pontiella agarivorans]|uniref:Beta-agarase n=1 Tax=Pontiella agarivorans TaxID=3038953 RepID=A0ABU5MYD0_9BACT|nr:hypothetical protein [Pontiella agarivorans]MDZ8119086.1 hypothetical protein [Pontiella agarivorans]
MRLIYHGLGALFAFLVCSETYSAEYIGLKVLNGRTTLIDPSGKPFFAHGVNHIGKNGQGAGRDAVSEACKALGFNAYGYGCPEALRDDMPYLESWNELIPMSMHRPASVFSYRDVFDPAVIEDIRSQIKKTCDANRENTNLIGYLWTDLAAWTPKNNHKTDFVAFMRELPADAPGRKAYENFAEKNQGNEAAFIRQIARQYFSVVGKATREFDPNHLVLGDRLTFQTAIPEVLEEMLPYVDVVSVQPNYVAGFPSADFDRLHKQAGGKPILICDFAIRFKDGDKKIRGRKLEENEAVAGEHYAAYIRAAKQTSYIIGAFWCNLIDSSPGAGKAGIKQGLFNPGLEPRPALSTCIKNLNCNHD